MTTRVLTVCAVVGALSSGACTLNDATPPALTGPSDYATSIIMTATPDTLLLNGQQAIVIVEARDATGGALANLRLHLDIMSGDVLSNCGRISLTDVTTGSDGRASVVFTAPKLPLPLPECANAAGGVTVLATPVGTNAQASTSFSVGIRFLTPTSNTPSSVFAVNFLISPNPGAAGGEITFADAGSVSPGHAITSFRWTFSDGAAKSGASVTHDFGAPGVYVATLTITDDIGQSGSKSGLVTIN